jgi:sarcosine oxidase subunit beta
MIDLSCGGHAPILGALYHAPGSVARHDAVAWGYGRGADMRGAKYISAPKCSAST